MNFGEILNLFPATTVAGGRIAWGTTDAPAHSKVPHIVAHGVLTMQIGKKGTYEFKVMIPKDNPGNFEVKFPASAPYDKCRPKIKEILEETLRKAFKSLIDDSQSAAPGIQIVNEKSEGILV